MITDSIKSIRRVYVNMADTQAFHREMEKCKAAMTEKLRQEAEQKRRKYNG